MQGVTAGHCGWPCCTRHVLRARHYHKHFPPKQTNPLNKG